MRYASLCPYSHRARRLPRNHLLFLSRTTSPAVAVSGSYHHGSCPIGLLPPALHLECSTALSATASPITTQLHDQNILWPSGRTTYTTLAMQKYMFLDDFYDVLSGEYTTMAVHYHVFLDVHGDGRTVHIFLDAGSMPVYNCLK